MGLIFSVVKEGHMKRQITQAAYEELVELLGHEKAVEIMKLYMVEVKK